MWQFLLLLLAPGASGLGCNAEEQCYQTDNWRCVESSQGSPCVLDRAYNLTGHCSCGLETCKNISLPVATVGALQYLVIGDSISMGYFKTLKNILEQNGTWEVFHAPGNNDNTNWGNRCISGWLGPEPMRWDAVSMNFGLHDLAYPDNEHLEVDTYETLLGQIKDQIQALVRPDTKLFWVTTTPVPTNPPPDSSGKDCALIPGRVEPDVLRYNEAAAKATGGVAMCDLHTVITDHCGIGFSTCDIAQCAGPHFDGDGFPMLGRAMASCISSAFAQAAVQV